MVFTLKKTIFHWSHLGKFSAPGSQSCWLPCLWLQSQVLTSLIRLEGFFWYSLQMAGFVMKGRRKPVQIFWMQHNLYLWGSRFASLLGVSGCPVSDFEGWDTKGSPFRFDTADSCFVFRWLHVVSQILGFEILGALPLVSNWFWTLRCYIRLRSLNKNLSQNRLGTDQAASQNDRVWCLQVCFGPTERWVVWWRQVSHSYCT